MRTLHIALTLLLVTMLCLTLVALQREDWEDPHPNQPDRCNNFKQTDKEKPEYCGAKCKTNCQPGPDGKQIITEERNCKVYCRKDNCDCFGHCDS